MHISKAPARTLSLADILGNENLSDTSQLKASKGKDGLYTDSNKPTGRFSSFSSAIAFVARFFKSSTKESFREANAELISLIKKDFGPQAAAAFEKDFSLRSRFGSPLTAGSVRRFCSNLTPTAENCPALKKTYGEEMTSTYQQSFLSHGKIEQTTTAEILSGFENLPPQEEAVTLLSQEVHSLSELGYHTDPSDTAFQDVILPTGGFAMIAGQKERAALLDDLLYSPLAKKDNIKSLLNAATRSVNEAEKNLASAQDDTDLVAEAEAEEQLSKAQESLQALEKETEGYVNWPSDRLAAFMDMHALLESVSNDSLLGSREIHLSTLAMLQEQTPEMLQQNHQRSIKGADEMLQQRQENLRTAELSPALPENQKKFLTSKLADAEQMLAKLKARSTDDLWAAHQKKIEATAADIETITSRAERIREETKDHKNWTPAKTLDYVARETAIAQRIDIKFDRIVVKINDAIVPCSDAKSYDENFALFKTALEKLAGKKLPDSQVTEMINLLNKNRSIQGFASGANVATGLGLGWGQSPFGDKNTFTIKLAENGAFDFHFDSGVSYLTSLQAPIEPKAPGRPNIILSNMTMTTNEAFKLELNNRNKAPSDLIQFETRKYFTYRYTPPLNTNEKGSLEITDSRQAYWPINVLPLKTQDAFDQYLNNPALGADKSLTANKTHQWTTENNQSHERLPDISEQVYKDLHRTNYAYMSAEGRKIELYDRSEIHDSLSEAQVEEKKQAAIKTFVSFVGDEKRAFAISKIANQQVAFAPLENLMYASENSIPFENYGKGQPLSGIKCSHLFLKDSNGDVVCRMSIQQKPKMFHFNPSGKEIELDPEKSFVNFDYDLTFKFDVEGNRSVKTGPIHYSYHLEKGENGLS